MQGHNLFQQDALKEVCASERPESAQVYLSTNNFADNFEPCSLFEEPRDTLRTTTKALGFQQLQKFRLQNMNATEHPDIGV